MLGYGHKGHYLGLRTNSTATLKKHNEINILKWMQTSEKKTRKQADKGKEVEFESCQRRSLKPSLRNTLMNWNTKVQPTCNCIHRDDQHDAEDGQHIHHFSFVYYQTTVEK